MGAHPHSRVLRGSLQWHALQRDAYGGDTESIGGGFAMRGATAAVVLGIIALIVIVVLAVPTRHARSEYILMVDGKPKHTYPNDAPAACTTDKMSEKIVRPALEATCIFIK